MKQSIFEVVQKEIALPLGTFIVLGSGVMAAYGIRDYGDVDLLVNKEAWDILLKRGWTESPMTHRAENMLWKDDMSAFQDFKYKDTYILPEDLIQKAEMIQGIPFLSLEMLIHFKQILGREKDLKDIELIRNFLEKKKNG